MTAVKSLLAKAIIITSALFSVTNVQAGLIEETWELEVTSTTGDYLAHAINETFEISFIYDDESTKMRFNQAGSELVYCSDDSVGDPDCHYNYPNFTMFSDVLINEVNDLFANFFAFDDLSANGGSYAMHNPDSSFATWRIREGGIVADHVQGVLYDPVEGRQSEFIASGFPDGQGGVFGVGNARLFYKDSSDQLLVNEMTFDVLSVNAVSLQAVSEPRTLTILSLCILGLVARKRAKANN